jgi:chemotaxis protein methyltransferase WspC
LRAPGDAAESPVKRKFEIDHALQLADQGQLVEAAKECEAHLHEHGPSAKAFYVMGLVRDASGSHADAAYFYRKALYLEPQYHEALVHLASLLDGQGDRAGARVMNDRARRVEPKVVKVT